MLVAVITRDGRMVGLYTSGVDAWQAAKPVGAVMWRCAPNSDHCETIQRAMTPERRAAPAAAGAAAAPGARAGVDCARGGPVPRVSDAVGSTYANTRFTTSEV